MKRVMRVSAVRVLCLISVISLSFATIGIAGTIQTTGGVNWIDPLGYEKPAFYPINVPDEGACPNKYYVNMSGGSGSTCSQASPCASINNVIGKAGTTGGPAYIYVKGSGGVNLYNVTLYGSSGNEVVIKPWPGETTAVTFKGSPNYVESPNIRYLVFDGGPNLLFKFLGSSGYGEGNSNGFALNINSNYLTFYRCQFLVNGGTEAVGISRNSGSVTGTTLINNEFYDNGTINGTAPLLYPGGGNSCSGASSTINNTVILNNIFRDAGPEAIEFNPRTLSDGVMISGNAFHNIGKVSCGTNWACRPAVILDGPSCGGQTRNVTITNNLMWDTGSGGVWDRGGASSVYIFNNTIYDYGKGGTGIPNPQGISSYSNGGKATVKNNAIYAPNGTSPFDGSAFVTATNLCASGKSCGSNSRVYGSNTFLSTDPNNENFLKIDSSSSAYGKGTTIPTVTVDYANIARPSQAFSVGAFELGSDADSLAAPANLRIVGQ